MSYNQTDTLENDRFDNAMRGHLAASVSQLSPQLRAQLVQRRNAAMRGEVTHRGHRLRTGAAAFATLCALAIGLQMRPDGAPGNGAPVDAALASVASNGRTHATMLDEDPEFYAWLASPDAQQVAME